MTIDGGAASYSSVCQSQAWNNSRKHEVMQRFVVDMQRGLEKGFDKPLMLQV